MGFKDGIKGKEALWGLSIVLGAVFVISFCKRSESSVLIQAALFSPTLYAAVSLSSIYRDTDDRLWHSKNMVIFIVALAICLVGMVHQSSHWRATQEYALIGQHDIFLALLYLVAINSICLTAFIVLKNAATKTELPKNHLFKLYLAVALFLSFVVVNAFV